jgi:hypothetical protein
MAKELPYFQFEPAEYLTKDISFCTLSAQGLFINICSYYWQRDCKLTKDQVLRRLNYLTPLDELISEGVIDLDGENISIKFLDKQRDKATELSKEQGRKGRLGGRPKKPNESQMKAEQKPNESQMKAEQKPNESRMKAEQKPNESHKIREEKIREDKIRKENINYTDSNDLVKKELFNCSEEFIKNKARQCKISIQKVKQELEKFWTNTYDSSDDELKYNDVKRHFGYWLDKQDFSHQGRKRIQADEDQEVDTEIEEFKA